MGPISISLFSAQSGLDGGEANILFSRNMDPFSVSISQFSPGENLSSGPKHGAIFHFRFVFAWGQPLLFFLVAGQ